MSSLTYLLWLALIVGAGWTAFPLARRALGADLPDSGLAVGRILFLGIWTMLAFWLGQFGFATSACAWLYVPLALTGLFVGWRDRAHLKLAWRNHKKNIVATEIIFLLVFSIFFGLRGFWSDVNGSNGEKSMDAALIGSLVRAQRLPPANPYSAGARVSSYYYFGPLQTALLTRASQTEVRWSYNLMCATLPALCFSALFSLGGALTGSRKGGAWVSIAVLGGGTLQPIYQWTHGGAAGGLLGLDPFLVSRVIPFTINEFPWFTFNQADLHGHYFDFPFQIALMSLGWSLYRAKKWQVALLAAIIAGATILTNTWDFPAFTLLIVLAIVVVSGEITGKSEFSEAELAPASNLDTATTRLEAGADPAPALWARIALALLVVAIALLLASPFLRHLSSAATPPRWLAQPASPLREWLLLWGPIAGCWWVFSLHQTLRASPIWRATIAIIGAGVVVDAVFSAWEKPSILVLPLIGVSVGLALTGMFLNRGAARYGCVLALCGLFALVWSETTWAGFLGNPENPLIRDSIRQDTVFKFGLQVWMLWGTASAAGLWMVVARGSRKFKAVAVAVALPVALVMLAGNLAFTLHRIRFVEMVNAQRNNDPNWWRFDAWDAWAHLAPPEKAAAAWLRRNVKPGENIVEAEKKEGGDFTEYARYTTVTGIPTVIGPLAHSFYWAPAGAATGQGKAGRDAKGSAEWTEVYRRKTDVRRIYAPMNNADRVQILRSYGVKYLVWGELERREYGEQTFADVAGLPVAAQFGASDDAHRVTIFRVN